MRAEIERMKNNLGGWSRHWGVGAELGRLEKNSEGESREVGKELGVGGWSRAICR